MIKFFRTIRKKLIEQSKVRNYFFYAIGEIILVVIGIFIAIQANNWNVERVAQKELAFELEKLVINLKQDTLEIHNRIKVNNEIISSLDSCLIVLKNPKAYSKRYFSELFFPINQTVDFISNKTSFNSLTTSGKLQKLKNNTLIDSLSYFYTIDGYKNIESAITNHTRDIIRPYLMGFDFITINDKMMNAYSDDDSFFTEPKTLDDYASDYKIINGIRFKIFLHKLLNASYVGRIKNTKRLINQINEEID